MNDYIDVLKKYAVFSDRARRKEYWMFVLWNIIIISVVYIVSMVINNSELYMYFALLYCLAVVIPSIAVTVRRLHDTNHNGWWIFISLVPFIGHIILLVFLVSDSQPGDNRYGPNPKGINNS